MCCDTAVVIHGQHMQLVLNWRHAVCIVSSYIHQPCPTLTSGQQLNPYPSLPSQSEHPSTQTHKFQFFFFFICERRFLRLLRLFKQREIKGI